MGRRKRAGLRCRDDPRPDGQGRPGRRIALLQAGGERPGRHDSYGPMDDLTRPQATGRVELIQRARYELRPSAQSCSAANGAMRLNTVKPRTVRTTSTAAGISS